MNTPLLAHAAALLLTLAGPAFAADVPRGMPAASFVPPFSWTGCYLGGHLGGGWAQKDMTDPVQLVQELVSRSRFDRRGHHRENQP